MAYDLYQSGELEKRVEQAFKQLSDCTICPWDCHVNRLEGEIGVCRVAKKAIVSSYMPHHGEEEPLVGTKGSGTIFFSFCNLRCIFCQNYELSQWGEGKEVSEEQIATMMLSLQNRGCHNINLVTPSHVVPQILKALLIAIPAGLKIPLVYNSSGYDSLETLKLLDGIIDIYMPDFKFSKNDLAKELSRTPNYADITKKAIKEMHKQVGDLQIENGLATKGLIIRHLVLPNHLDNTRKVLSYIAEDLSKDTYLNLMDQYYPAYKAHKHPVLKRPLTSKELKEALSLAKELGLTRLA